MVAVVAAVVVITATSFFLKTVFAFAIAGQGPPLIRPAFTQTRSHLPGVLGTGGTVGVLLALAAVAIPRWEARWFAISLSVAIAIMMVCYVAVPARLIGIRTTQPKRDKLAATAVGAAVGAVVCTPPYVLGRVGLLILDSGTLFVLGVAVFAAGLTLQAAATGAVKAVKMSAKLLPWQNPGERG